MKLYKLGQRSIKGRCNVMGKSIRKLFVVFFAGMVLGIMFGRYPFPALGQSTLSICTESTAPCPSGGCQPDEHCGVIGSTGKTCGCVPNQPWPPSPY
jgi:hypothetical protein